MKKQKTLPLLLLLTIAALIFNNCSRKVNEQTFRRVAPPFEKINVAFNENSIDAEKGGELKFEYGTKIVVPADAFVTGDGTPVKTKVKLKYREFHNSSQILLSGIPMTCNGKNFQTAGMFEVNGNTETNEVLKIAEGKSLSVELASNVNDGDYRLYYFDEKEGEWLDRGNSLPKVNEDKKQKLEALLEVPAEPLEPQEQKDNSLVFDLEVNTSLYPELRDFHGIVWQYAGTDGKNNPDRTPWVFSETWSYVELQKNEAGEGLYNLSLKSKKKEFTTVVVPVLKGKYYREALAKFEVKMNRYETALAARKTVEEQVSRQADLVRSFTVNNFGIYNCDRFYNAENLMRVAATFQLDREIPGVDINNITVYQLTGNDRAVISYSNSYYRENFVFNPNDINKLVAVLPGDKIAVCDNEAFTYLSETLQPREKTAHTFILHVLDNQVITADNITRVLGSI